MTLARIKKGDDVIVLTPSGASGAAVPMHFSVTVRAA